MTIGYRDPKSGGDTWGTTELLTPTQANIIASNQRHFARSQWMGLDQIEQSIGLHDIATLTIDSSANTKRVYWIGAHGTTTITALAISSSAIPELTLVEHLRPTTGINGIYSVAARPNSRGWWGLESQAGAASGYYSWSGPGGDFFRTDRAGPSTGVKRANAMAYAEDLDALVAAWSDGWVEWNTNGTSWGGQKLTSANLNYVLYGNENFVAMSATTVSTVYVSNNGTAWEAVALPGTLSAARLSFDAGENKWYVVGTDTSGTELIVYASVSPATSWMQVNNTTVPEPDGTVVAFVAHGGIWGLVSGGVLFVSADYGQNWVAQSVAGTNNVRFAKFAGGRLHVAGPNSSTTRHHYTQPFFPPYPSI
jgi:hypothetical protein